MEIETLRLSILKQLKHLKSNDVLLQIENLLRESAKEDNYKDKATISSELMGIPQKPRRCKTDFEELARKQNYNPDKQKLIGALPTEDISFIELSEIIGK